MSSRICITFKAGQQSALKRISQESGAPIAELVRRAVDSFVVERAASDDRAPVQPGRDESGSSRSTPPS